MSANQTIWVISAAFRSLSDSGTDRASKQWTAAAECSGGVSVVYPGGRLDLEEEVTDVDAAERVDNSSSSVSAAEVSVTSVPSVDHDVDGMLSDQTATDDDGDVTLSSVSSAVGENDTGYPKPVSAVDTVVRSPVTAGAVPDHMGSW